MWRIYLISCLCQKFKLLNKRAYTGYFFRIIFMTSHYALPSGSSERFTIRDREAIVLRKIHPKVGLLKPKIMPSNFLNSKKNFKKVHKSIFFTLKMAKSRVSNWPKVSIFGSIFALRALFLAFWYWIFFLSLSS